MNLTFERSTFDAEHYVQALNAKLAAMHEAGKTGDRQAVIASLLNDASLLAYHGANNREGGPFGALIVDFHAAPPRVVGMGTNHVVPWHDPTAHAEMTAIRDAAARMRNTDFSGLTLITSCECCPQCLATAMGTNMEAIYFSATRQDAADVDFSDADLYRLLAEGGIECHAAQAQEGEGLEAWLNGHDAAVVVRGHDGAPIVFYGDDETRSVADPTALPCVQAIRAACRGLGVFHLPEDALLISRRLPHPLELSAADWARIGRVRDADFPDNPALDAPQKDTSRIRYLTAEPQRLVVRGASGSEREMPPQRLWEQINLAPEDRDIPAHHVTEGVTATRLLAFHLWRELIGGKEMPRY